MRFEAPFGFGIMPLPKGVFFMPNRPMEFWKVIVYDGDAKIERIFGGKGGRKKALEYAAISRRKKEYLRRTEVFCCIPRWTLHERWEP